MNSNKLVASWLSIDACWASEHRDWLIREMNLPWHSLHGLLHPLFVRIATEKFVFPRLETVLRHRKKLRHEFDSRADISVCYRFYFLTWLPWCCSNPCPPGLCSTSAVSLGLDFHGTVCSKRSRDLWCRDITNTSAKEQNLEKYRQLLTRSPTW